MKSCAHLRPTAMVGLPMYIALRQVCWPPECSNPGAIGTTTFTLNSASVDPEYACPAGTDKGPYALHATIEVRNGTSNGVAIKSTAAVLTLAAVKGGWLDHVGYKYKAEGVTFSPAWVSGLAVSRRVHAA